MLTKMITLINAWFVRLHLYVLCLTKAGTTNGIFWDAIVTGSFGAALWIVLLCSAGNLGQAFWRKLVQLLITI